MGSVALKEEFRMPLNSQEEAVGGRFDRFHDAIRSDSTGDKRWGYPLDGLMMGAVHHQTRPADDFSEEALWRHRHRMGHMDRFCLLPVIQRMLNL